MKVSQWQLLVATLDCLGPGYSVSMEKTLQLAQTKASFKVVMHSCVSATIMVLFFLLTQLMKVYTCLQWNPSNQDSLN